MNSFNEPCLSIGHRGASAYAPENTMAAFRKAYQIGADGIELDVQLSKDNHVIIMHDYRLDRTTTGKGLVSKKTLKELKSLDAGQWFSKDFKSEPILTLRELLEFAKGKMLVNIELKKSKQPIELVRAVKSLVDEYDMLNDCLLTSFDKNTVKAVSSLVPTIRNGLLVDKVSKADLAGDWPYLAVHWESIDEELVVFAKAHGKDVVAWTVNDETAMLKLLDLGVGKIITNYPEIAKNMIEKRKKT